MTIIIDHKQLVPHYFPSLDEVAGLDDTEIAQRINGCIQDLDELFMSGFRRIMLIGYLLTQKKKKVQKGGWLAWLSAHVPCKQSSCKNYMQLWRWFSCTPEDKWPSTIDGGLEEIKAARHHGQTRPKPDKCPKDEQRGEPIPYRCWDKEPAGITLGETKEAIGLYFNEQYSYKDEVLLYYAPPGRVEVCLTDRPILIVPNKENSHEGKLAHDVPNRPSAAGSDSPNGTAPH